MKKEFLVLIIAVVVVLAVLLIFQKPSSSVSGEVTTGNAITDILKVFGYEKEKGGGNSNSGSVWEDLYRRCGIKGGEHYTLNIHGKKDGFNKQDCTADPDPITGEYGNNIFVPSESDPSVRNQIIMMSGNSKGKWASTGQTYGVRDSCTASFDGDAAELVIPANQNGYCVFARVLGKPTNDPSLTLEGDLIWVEDEYGNDLLVLGMVTDNGFETPYQTLTRTKGKTKAVDITGLFEWSGSVCYFDGSNYCTDPSGEYVCTQKGLCCVDSNSDGIYDECTDPLIDELGVTYCSDGSAVLSAECLDYTNEWVFNIGDFVGYMWDAYTDGSFKLANIRFYPM